MYNVPLHIEVSKGVIHLTLRVEEYGDERQTHAKCPYLTQHVSLENECAYEVYLALIDAK